ncbi:MAG: hypothetical protein ACYSW8_28475 [Planctomycetota bacterium]|jgi:signal transduction histidine kinase
MDKAKLIRDLIVPILLIITGWCMILSLHTKRIAVKSLQEYLEEHHACEHVFPEKPWYTQPINE